MYQNYKILCPAHIKREQTNYKIRTEQVIIVLFGCLPSCRDGVRGPRKPLTEEMSVLHKAQRHIDVIL